MIEHIPPTEKICGSAIEAYVAETKCAADKALKELVEAERHAICRDLFEAAIAVDSLRERPLLCRIAADSCGGNWLDLLPAATAIELLHLASLVADDVADRSRMRGTRKALWQQDGVGLAILTSQLMVARAYELFHQAHFPSELGRRMAFDLFQSSWDGLLRGQILDLRVEGSQIEPAESLSIIRLTTGSLTEAACGVGALGGPTLETKTCSYWKLVGRYFGVGLQLFNDAAELVNPASSDPPFPDIAAHKPRFIYMWGRSDSSAAVDWPALETEPARHRAFETALASLAACASKVQNLLPELSSGGKGEEHLISLLLSALICELQQHELSNEPKGVS